MECGVAHFILLVGIFFFSFGVIFLAGVIFIVFVVVLVFGFCSILLAFLGSASRRERWCVATQRAKMHADMTSQSAHGPLIGLHYAPRP